MAAHESHGPRLQLAMFRAGLTPDAGEVATVADQARTYSHSVSRREETPRTACQIRACDAGGPVSAMGGMIRQWDLLCCRPRYVIGWPTLN